VILLERAVQKLTNRLTTTQALQTHLQIQKTVARRLSTKLVPQPDWIVQILRTACLSSNPAKHHWMEVQPLHPHSKLILKKQQSRGFESVPVSRAVRLTSLVHTAARGMIRYQ